MEINEFRALLEAKGVRTASCPTCGANAWGGLDDNVLLRVQRAEPFEGEDVLPEDTVQALSATCGNCGFICLFDPSILKGQGDASR